MRYAPGHDWTDPYGVAPWWCTCGRMMSWLWNLGWHCNQCHTITGADLPVVRVYG